MKLYLGGTAQLSGVRTARFEHGKHNNMLRHVKPAEHTAGMGATYCPGARMETLRATTLDLQRNPACSIVQQPPQWRHASHSVSRFGFKFYSRTLTPAGRPSEVFLPASWRSGGSARPLRRGRARGPAPGPAAGSGFKNKRNITRRSGRTFWLRNFPTKRSQAMC